MKLRNYLLSIIFTLFFGIFAQSALGAMAVAWDAYTDPIATGLRLEESTDQSNWTIAVDNIPTSDTAVAIPTHQTENERVFYRLVAFNSTDVSSPSNVISYFWTTGGGGYEGLQTPGLIKFIDCNDPQGAEVQICDDLGLSGN